LQFLDAVHRFLERLSRIAVWIGGAGLLICAIMVTVDVFSRKFLSITMSGSDEYTGYVFAAATTWAYSYVVLHRSNVRIDALYNLFPMPVRAVLDIFGLILLLIFISVLLYLATNVFATSWRQGSVAITALATPLWIPQLAWLLGLWLLEITLIFVIIHATVALLSGDVLKVQALAGTMSIQDEIREETRGMGLDN
jgi:TRAP-type C4-dicarboxylate transport system permease small subunit